MQALRLPSGLLLAALGLILLIVPTAHAEWRIQGESIKSSTSISGSAHTKYSILVPSKSLEIHCEKSSIKSGLLLAIPFVNSHVILEVESCKTLQAGKESAACKPQEPISLSAEGSMILHNGKNYMLFKPASGTAFGTINYNEEICILPDTKVNGLFVAECLTESLTAGNCSEELVNHLIQQAPTSLFSSDGLLYGINTATLDGVTKLFLNGANTGRKWSGSI